MRKYNMHILCMMTLLFLQHMAYAGLQLHFKGGLQGKMEDTHEPVIVVAQGDEYIVQVVSNEACDDDLIINGVENAAGFEVSRGHTSNTMTMINGRTKTSVTYTYHVRPLVVGAYTLGPALCESASGRITSNVVKIRVVEPAAYDNFAGKKGASRGAFRCVLTVNEHEVYVGQQLVLKVSIEDDGSALERGLQPPSFGRLQAEPLGKAVSSQKVVNGQLKVITEQEYRISADTVGTYTIDPAVAYFIVPDEDYDRGMGGFFGNIFGGGGKKRSVRSNSMIVAVKPLPQSSEPVDGVGVFSEVSLKLSKSTLDLNEPCTATFTLVGDGNFDAIVAPALVLSDDISIYPSTTSYTPASQGSGVKTFEYIMQVGAAGEHEIDAQSFSYFDTTAGEYKKLYTEPLIIQVKKAKTMSVDQASVLVPEERDKKGVVQPVDHRDALPVIPWWLLLVASVVIMAIIFRDLLSSVFALLQESVGITSRAKRERARLQRMITEQEVTLLYSFFSTILARAWRCDTALIDQEYVETRAHEWGWEMGRCQSFGQYIEQCSQAAFAPQMVKEVTKTELLDKALYWYELTIAELKEKDR